MEDDVREKVLEGKDIRKIAEACNRYPSIGLECKLAEKDGEDVQMAVTLTREEEL